MSALFFVGLFLWVLGVCGPGMLFFRMKVFKCAWFDSTFYNMILADPALSKDWTGDFFYPVLLHDYMYLGVFLYSRLKLRGVLNNPNKNYVLLP